MVHTVKIFVLYVGIIEAIQEHANDYCCGGVQICLYIYIQIHWVTHLKV
jgi:hypothetical protein